MRTLDEVSSQCGQECPWKVLAQKKYTLCKIRVCACAMCCVFAVVQMAWQRPGLPDGDELELIKTTRPSPGFSFSFSFSFEAALSLPLLLLLLLSSSSSFSNPASFRRCLFNACGCAGSRSHQSKRRESQTTQWKTTGAIQIPSWSPSVARTTWHGMA